MATPTPLLGPATDVLRSLKGDGDLVVLRKSLQTSEQLDVFVDQTIHEALITRSIYEKEYEHLKLVFDTLDPIVEAEQEALATSSVPLLGGLGFVLLAKEIDLASDDVQLIASEIPKDHNIAKLFAIPAIRRYFCHWYGFRPDPTYLLLPEDVVGLVSDDMAPRLIRVGTTSFLVTCVDGTSTALERIALKCLIPRYVGPELPSVNQGPARQLKEYRAIFDAIRKISNPESHLTPSELKRRIAEVKEPESETEPPRFAAMEFIDGPTLGDRIQYQQSDDDHKLVRPRRKRGPILRYLLRGVDSQVTAARYSASMLHRLQFVSELTENLCPTLSTIEEIHHPHLDLSPSNVILRNGRSDPDFDQVRNPVLIDFGRNTLVYERVGSSDRWERTRTYIAPELRSSRRYAENPDRADLFFFRGHRSRSFQRRPGDSRNAERATRGPVGARADPCRGCRGSCR